MKYKFKDGITLQDLINTRPCLDEFCLFMKEAGFSMVHPVLCLDVAQCNKAANSKPEWQDYGLKHGLLEETEQPLSFKIEVDGEVVWEGDGNRLHIAENDWWVLELTKDGYRCLNYVHGSLRGTNIANDGHFICKSWAFDYLNDDSQVEEEL